MSSLLLQVDVNTDRRGLQSALSRTLSDPDLALMLPSQNGPWWLDADGERINPTDPAGQIDIPIPGPDGRDIARLRVDPTKVRHRAFLDATVAAAALLLRNMSAVDELRDLPARIAEGSYRERRRIERDLHDGAQQRLIALGMSIDQIQRSGLADPTRQLAANAAAELQEAVQELRDLARGTYPGVLTERGLRPAIESAADRMPLDVIIDIPDHRWSGAIEATAYFLICEAITNVAKHASCDRVEVRVRDDGNAVTVSVTDEGRGGAVPTLGSGLAGLTDRVHALGGSLHLASTEGIGTCLTAVLPYA